MWASWSGCRGQLPGWQSFYAEHGEAVEVVVIAQDAQGAELARPWVEKAGGTYRALLDQYNFIGKAYNLKYVSVGIALDETGRLVRPVGSVNIQDAEFLADLKEWAETDGIPKRWCG